MIKLLDRWTVGQWTARACPVCACDPDHPCIVVAPHGQAPCVPAGAFDLDMCSSCKAKETMAKSSAILKEILPK